MRVITSTTNSAEQDLLTIRAGDLEQGYAELTSRLRGYEDTPTVEGALAELDWLVGLDPVKQQVRAIAAQLRVAKMRSRQGLSSQPPARHFVFTGPPGTGKTTVARILGRIFAALGLLVRPEVIEAHRADLVGEHLGSTAIKTGKLIDSAMGGVLFIDEAYSLNNAGYDGGDAFGAEAVQTLLKRAEDDRDRLVIVLAGYPDDMDRFLRSNPGLASRFSTRVTFPSYSPNELVEIAGRLAKGADDRFDPAALEVLRAIFAQACAEGRIDELGNGRFARSLYERACACRDLRVENLADPSRDDLITLTAADVQAAYGELRPRHPRPARWPFPTRIRPNGPGSPLHGQPGAVLATGGLTPLAPPTGSSGSTAAARSPTSSRAARTARWSRTSCCPRTRSVPRRRGRRHPPAARPGAGRADPGRADRRGEDGHHGRHQRAARAQGRAAPCWSSRAASRDALRIAYQNRPRLFDRHIVLPELLYERVDRGRRAHRRARRRCCVPLDEAQLARELAGAYARRASARVADRLHARLPLPRARARDRRARARGRLHAGLACRTRSAR